MTPVFMTRIRILIIDGELGEGNVLKYMASMPGIIIVKKTSEINRQIIKSFNPEILLVSNDCYSHKALIKRLLLEREEHQLPLILFSAKDLDDNEVKYFRKHQISEFIFPTDHPAVVLSRLENLARTFAVKRITDRTKEITERKKAMSDRERYQILADISFEGIIILHHEMIREFNDTFLSISGYHRDDLLGSNFIKDFIPQKYHHRFSINNLMNCRFPVEIEIIRKDEQLITVEVEMKNVFMEGEQMVVVAVRDIIRRKQDEQEIKDLSLALDQSANTVIITDNNGNIEYVNKAFTKTTGYTFEDVISQNPRIL